MSRSEIVQQGWLIKSPPTKGIFRPRWRRRWFVLRTGDFPNQFVLEYFTDQSVRRQKGRINLDECEQLVGPLSVQERHKYTFQIRTPSRTYYLAADCEREMRKWVASLCQVCSLKTVEEESEGTVVYSRAGDENNQPEANVQSHEEVTESDDSSPTLSNKIHSGPYIPISECFTGKPILLSETGDVTYCNTSVFQFPPKVNWATHPVKHADTGGTPNSTADAKMVVRSGVVAPPRPPKKHGPAIAVTITSPEPSSVEVGQIKSPVTVSEVEEIPDSASTCPSLHSPPGSAGVVYSNISDICENKHGRLRGSSTAFHGSKSNSSTSPSPQGVPPPVVDRNLKPLRRDRLDADVKSLVSNASPTQKLPTPSYSSGTMTLPSRYHHNNHTFPAEPVVDRSIKPPDGQLSLGPTPAQMKVRSQSNQSFSTQYNQRLTGTLPSSPHRRAGPIVSPNDKRLVYHQYEQAAEMKGTYLQIDCQSNKGTVSPKFPLSNLSSTKKGFGSFHSVDPGSSVEYRLIDPVKTKALNKTIEDRERQLRNNTLGKHHN